MSMLSSVDELIVTTSVSGLSVVGGTKALKTLVLEESAASEEALSLDWAVWPNSLVNGVCLINITGRRKDLLEVIRILFIQLCTTTTVVCILVRTASFPRF